MDQVVPKEEPMIDSSLSSQSVLPPPCLHHGEDRGSHSLGMVVEREIIEAGEGGETALRMDVLVQSAVSF